MTEQRRFPVGLTIATAIAFVILCGLGAWQMERLGWKRDLLARIKALQAAPARPLEQVLGQGDVAFARVTAVCPGLATAPFVELYAIHEGQAGSRLISACRLPDGRSILVDRGFVQDIISARPPVDPTDARPTGVRGVLRAPEERTAFAPKNRPDVGRFFGRQIDPLAAALKAQRPVPYFLMAETSTNPEWKALTPSPLPAQISNRHLEYALTWFGLAGALLAVYAALLWGRFKR